MKAKIIQAPNVNRFHPFVVSLQIETPEEARLLYHVCNRSDLKKVLMKENTGYFFADYSQEIEEAFHCGYDEIKNELREQGFRV